MYFIVHSLRAVLARLELLASLQKAGLGFKYVIASGFIIGFPQRFCSQKICGKRSGNGANMAVLCAKLPLSIVCRDDAAIPAGMLKAFLIIATAPLAKPTHTVL